jgi:hypothetical protein
MNISKLMPSKTYVLITRLSIEEVSKRIAENIKPDRKTSTYEFHNPLKRQYEGKLASNAFSIHQVIVGRRNSFAPLITGFMSTQNDKTHIDIKMEVLPFVKTFMALWLGAVGFACILVLFVELLNITQVLHYPFNPFLLIPFIMFLFGCYLPFAAFKTQRDNSRYYLIKLLDGHEEGI